RLSLQGRWRTPGASRRRSRRGLSYPANPIHNKDSPMPPSALPPLDQVDPVRAWQPWEPDAQDPWGRKWAGHLYRRAAFGATLDELRAAEKAGHRATLDKLCKGDPGREQYYEEKAGSFMVLGKYAAGTYKTPMPFQPAQPFLLPGWWLY